MAYLNFITLGSIDLQRIWDIQEVPETVTSALDNLCDRIKAELEASAQTVGKSLLSASKTKNLFLELKNKDLGFNTDNIREILNDNQ